MRDFMVQPPDGRQKTVTVIACFVVTLIALFLLYSQARKANAISYLYSDKSTSILASRSIAETGLPRLPNGKLYYRDFVAHYLNGLGIVFFGDSLRGCRAASLAAYAVLVMVPSLVLCIKVQRPVLAGAYCILVGLSHYVQRYAGSARMYMIYMALSALVVLILVCPQCRAKKFSPYLYAAFLLLAMFSHLHFVVILPGILVAGSWIIWSSQKGTLRQFIRAARESPYVWLPMGVAGCGILSYVAMKYLPNAWINTEAVPIVFGREHSFSYPQEILGQALVFRPSLVILALLLYKYFKKEQICTVESSAASIVFFVAYIFVSLSLPHQHDRFVVALIPLLVLFLVSLGLKSALPLAGVKRRLAILITCCGLIVTGAIEFQHHKDAALRVGLGQLFWREDPAFLQAVTQTGAWIREHGAVVISSEPSMTMIVFDRFDYHLRTLYVAAANPCDRLESSYSKRLFIHSRELLEHVEQQ